MDDEDIDDDDSFTGPNAAGERLAMEHIKPIIASHLGSPQGSIDLTIDSGVPNAEDSGARTSAEAEKGNSAAAPPSKKERGSGSDGGSHNDDKK